MVLCLICYEFKDFFGWSSNRRCAQITDEGEVGRNRSRNLCSVFRAAETVMCIDCYNCVNNINYELTAAFILLLKLLPNHLNKFCL